MSNETSVVLLSRGKFEDRFIRFVGDEGWIQVDDPTDKITAEPADIVKQRRATSRSWAHPEGHIASFLRCMKTRQETICSPEKSHRATTIGHIANRGSAVASPGGATMKQSYKADASVYWVHVS